MSTGWNRPSAESKVTAKKKPSPVRGIVAGGIVILLAAAAYFLFMRGPERPAASDPKDGKRAIKEATPSSAKRPARADAHGGAAGVGQRAGTTSAQQNEGTASVQQQGVATNAEGAAGKEKPKDNRTFKNAMDQLLSMVMPHEVGGDVPPLPISDDMVFSGEDEKAILERLTADEKDSDAVLERKELVQAMRDEYLDLKKRGWTFIDYLKALEAKHRLDTEVRDESYKLHETVFNDPQISDEKYLETLGKINEVLSQRGIKPIKPPSDEAEEGEAADAAAPQAAEKEAKTEKKEGEAK